VFTRLVTVCMLEYCAVICCLCCTYLKKMAEFRILNGVTVVNNYSIMIKNKKFHWCSNLFYLLYRKNLSIKLFGMHSISGTAMRLAGKGKLSNTDILSVLEKSLFN
jgi:hypothetical protein